MSNFLRRLAYRFQEFMVGRYGYDMLSKFLLITSVIFCILSTVTRISVFYFLAVLMLGYSYIRMFSKNILARRKELDAYIKLRGKVLSAIGIHKKIYSERKTYKYVKCPECKSYWRFPKGVGKIEITCKKCKHKMIKKI